MVISTHLTIVIVMIWNHPVETTNLIPGCFTVQRTIMIFTSFQKSTSNKEDSLMLPCFFRDAKSQQANQQRSKKRTRERINHIVFGNLLESALAY